MHCRILVAIDGSTCAQSALQEAIALAADEQARLCLLHLRDEDACDAVGGMPAVPAGLLAAARLTAAAQGVQADTSLRPAPRARVADLICDEAVEEGCDLIVIGASGRGQATGLGSVAQRVLSKAKVPVVLVREQAGHATVAAAAALP
jgi:nucleotide-binding universal stress UspA family protein